MTPTYSRRRVRAPFGQLVASALSIAILALPAAGAAAPVIREVPAPSSGASEIPLQPGAKGTGAPESWFLVDGVPVVRNVTAATITPFLPAAGKATGAAVVIAPGGAFIMLAMDHEGWALARSLQSQGVAAFVVKYRVAPTKPGQTGFAEAIAGLAAPPPPGPPAHLAPLEMATDDVAEAVRLVRRRAGEWNIDPKRIGLLGFSAGALTSLNLVYRDDPETRPAFVAPIYGAMGPPAKSVPNMPPPLWAALAADDPLFGRSNFELLPAWRAKGGAVEFHLFEKGGHGFGYPGPNSASSGRWGDQFFWWLKAAGFLGKSGS